jgi:hypothetical protein
MPEPRLLPALAAVGLGLAVTLLWSVWLTWAAVGLLWRLLE